MVRTIEIPYHTGSLPLKVAEEHLQAVVTVREPRCAGSEEELLRRALLNPIGSPPLRALARGKKKVLIITSDHTRAVPSKLTLPLLLEEIRSAAPEAEIAILIATGLHRATTEAEQREKFGDGLVDKETFYVHDATKAEDMREICRLPSGALLSVNRLAVECDLLIAEGFIEPHFVAGFSGGRKSILPGISSEETIKVNHSYPALASPRAVSGVLRENPVHEDMAAAARAVNLQFILNVALDADKKIIAAFAGDPEQAHRTGCRYLSDFSLCQGVTGDIVVTGNGGYPLDQNLYQAPKAVSTAALCAGKDGVIVMCCACSDGFGGDYYKALMTSGSVEEIDRRLAAIPPEETIPEQWCVQVFLKVLKEHPVILVNSHIPSELIRKANLIPAQTLDEAMEIARSIKGPDARVVAIPDGVAVLFDCRL